MVDYICWSKDKDNLKRASSGGIMYELARYMIQERGGMVIGVDRDLQFTVAKTLFEVEQLQGSKYNQPFGLLTVIQFMNLNLGTDFLFVGTPCQVAKVKRHCNCDRILLVSLVCHGYLQSGKEDRINRKDNGWSNSSTHLSKGFLDNTNLLTKCKSCKLSHYDADITLSDAWWCPKHLVNEYGTSRVRVNTQKGLDVFDRIEAYITFFKESHIIKDKIALLDVHDVHNFGNCLLATNFIHYTSKYEPSAKFVISEKLVSNSSSIFNQILPTTVQDKIYYRTPDLIKDKSILSKLKNIYSVLLNPANDTDIYKDCNQVVVLGGDCFSGDWHWRWLRWTLFFWACHKSKLPVSFVSNTVGNFPWYIRLFGMGIWRKLSFYVRDEWSVAQLKKVGISSTLHPDLGLLDLPEIPSNQLKKTSYSIISPSFLWEKYADTYEDYMDKLVLCTTFLKRLNNGNVIIMPHTTDEKCIKIVKQLSRNTDCYYVLPKNVSQARSIMHQSNFVLAFRMHCAVQAIQVGVPTVVVGYSEKYTAVVEDMLGRKNAVAQLHNVIEKISMVFNKKYKKVASKALEDEINRKLLEKLILNNKGS